MTDPIFSEVRENGYRIPRQEYTDSGQEDRQVNAAKYIDHLASVTLTDIEKCPIALFINPDTGYLFNEKERLNKVFFQWKEDKTQPAVSLPVDLQIIIRASFERARESITSGTHRGIRSEERFLATELSSLQSRREKLFLDKLMLKNFNALDPSMFVQDVDRLLENGFFKFEKWGSGNQLSFSTMPVVLTYYNPAQGRDNTVNMGTYRVTFQFTSHGLVEYITPLADNPYVYDKYHPHVDSKRMCFGSAQLNAERYRSEFNLLKLGDLIRTVLTSYNEDSAYGFIYAFEESVTEGRFDPYEDEPEDDENRDEDRDDEDSEDNDEDEDNAANDWIPTTTTTTYTAVAATPDATYTITANTPNGEVEF